ncbi:hypothetical protein D3C86_1351160 [compost metagenome]
MPSLSQLRETWLIEDEDSKIRRNLIVVSVVIVLLWWLKVPLGEAAGKLLNVTLDKKVTESRLWRVGLIGLLYFAMRFKFSQEHIDDFTKMKEEFLNYRDGVLLWVLRQNVAWTQGAKALGTFHERIASRHGYTRKEVAANLKVHAIKVHNAMFGFVNASKERVRPEGGQVRAELEWAVTSAKGTNRWLEPDLNFYPPKRFLAAIWLISAAKLTIYSRTCTSFLVPWGLAAVAAFVAGYQVISTW